MLLSNVKGFRNSNFISQNPVAVERSIHLSCRTPQIIHLQLQFLASLAVKYSRCHLNHTLKRPILVFVPIYLWTWHWARIKTLENQWYHHHLHQTFEKHALQTVARDETVKENGKSEIHRYIDHKWLNGMAIWPLRINVFVVCILPY